MYCVYIITNKDNTTLYTGVTNNISRRMYEHKSGTYEGFSKKYHLYKLIYLEEYSEINQAIAREKQIKAWRREKKFELIQKKNPTFSEYVV